MSTPVERLRGANRYEMKLDNGIPITYRLPFMEELVICGLLPLTLLDELRQRMETGLSVPEAEDVADASMEERLTDYETDFDAKQRVVALMVTAVDGEEVMLTREETLEIPAPNFRLLVSIAIRQEPVNPGEALPPDWRTSSPPPREPSTGDTASTTDVDPENSSLTTSSDSHSTSPT